MTMTNGDCARQLSQSLKLRTLKPHQFVLWATARMGSVERECFERTWRNGGHNQTGYLSRMGYTPARQLAQQAEV
jgi:hypothetical protein